ncbi:hypothetical protein M514_10216, partial [Trichuris suis]
MSCRHLRATWLAYGYARCSSASEGGQTGPGERRQRARRKCRTAVIGRPRAVLRLRRSQPQPSWDNGRRLGRRPQPTSDPSATPGKGRLKGGGGA